LLGVAEFNYLLLPLIAAFEKIRSEKGEAAAAKEGI